ncbi:MAG: hypothetical protein HY401_03415 [Elusimicrobia bacterium]|nr:hypothetical protein [Elusimicrobiota bacterium]
MPVATDSLEDKASLVEFIQAFLDFEQKNGLFSIKIKGHYFWDYVRYAVFYQYVYSHCHEYVEPKKSNLFWHVAQAQRYLVYLFLWLLKKKDPYDVLVVNYDRNRFFNGRYVNITTYPIIEKLNRKLKILLIDPARLDVDIESNYPCDVLRYRPFYLLDKVLSRFFRYNNKEKAVFEEIGLKFQERFGISIDLLALAKQHYSFQIQSYRRYLGYFKKYKPKVVMYADNAHLKGLIEAANEIGIPTVDLQHSLISPVNILYNYPSQAGGRRLPTLSKFVFTFGDFWHPEYRLPIHPVAVGFPFLEIGKREPASAGLVRLPDNKAGKRIIFISDHYFSKSQSIGTALALSDLLPEHVIYYKLRPEDYRNSRLLPEEFRLKENIKVIDNDLVSLYEYFKICSYQIGINSTALYEGLAFGLTTFVLKTGLYREMERLYEGGHVFLASNPEEIARKILIQDAPATLDMNRVFRTDSLTNIENILPGIIEGGGHAAEIEKQNTQRS